MLRTGNTMQWKSPAAFEKDLKAKSVHRTMSTRKAHADEKAQVLRAASKVPSSDQSQELNPEHHISINNIQFAVLNGGSKLKRLSSEQSLSESHPSWLSLILPDDPSLAARTPKEVSINGVLFKRSKNGNLLRAKAITRWVISEHLEMFITLADPVDSMVQTQIEEEDRSLPKIHIDW